MTYKVIRTTLHCINSSRDRFARAYTGHFIIYKTKHKLLGSKHENLSNTIKLTFARMNTFACRSLYFHILCVNGNAKKVKIRPYLVSKLKMKQYAVRKKEKGVPFINAFFLQIMGNKTKLCGGRDNDVYILMTNILF